MAYCGVRAMSFSYAFALPLTTRSHARRELNLLYAEENTFALLITI